MIYMDNAATSWPKPDTVIKAVENSMKYAGGNPGRGGHRLSVMAAETLLLAREELGSLFDADPMRFVFCSGCTEALNIAIKGMLWPGAHVITTVYEHNSVLRPLNTLKYARDITVTVIQPSDDGRVLPLQIMRAVRGNTALIVMNHMSNVTGAEQPVQETAALCERYGVPLLVDLAQSAGHKRISLGDLGCMAAIPGHKGLLGPAGTGALYLGPHMPRPLKEGGTGTESFSPVQPDDPPERYEAGTPNTPGIAGLAAGVRYVREHFESLNGNIMRCSDILHDALSAMPFVRLYSRKGSPVAAFNIADMPSGEAADMLDGEYGIAARAGAHCAPLLHRFLGTEAQGIVRLSPGAFTETEEAEAAAAAVYSIGAVYKGAY